jgi:hypothetical protein
MTGYEQYNFPAFASYAKQLRDKGYYVFSPAENDFIRYGNDFLDHPDRFNPRLTISDDCRWIIHYADAVALMPGWQKSSGVAVEKALADFLKLEIIYLA